MQKELCKSVMLGNKSLAGDALGRCCPNLSCLYISRAENRIKTSSVPKIFILFWGGEEHSSVHDKKANAPVLLHVLEGRIKVRQTRCDQDRFTTECWWGRKGHSVSVSRSSLVTNCQFLPPEINFDSGLGPRPTAFSGGGQLPPFNANRRLFTPAWAYRVMKTAGVGCSQETKAYLGGEAVPWRFFIHNLFNIA